MVYQTLILNLLSSFVLFNSKKEGSKKIPPLIILIL